MMRFAFDQIIFKGIFVLIIQGGPQELSYGLFFFGIGKVEFVVTQGEMIDEWCRQFVHYTL
jgi:hypothetical protein